MTFPVKGGKGQKFEPGITHVRCPVPLKEVVQTLVGEYRRLYGKVTDPKGTALIRRVNDAIVNQEPLSGYSSASKPVNDCQAETIPVNGYSSAPQPVNDYQAETISVNGYNRLEEELRKAKEKVQFLEQRATQPNPKVEQLGRELQVCLNANTTMQAESENDRKLLEEAVKQRDHYQVQHDYYQAQRDGYLKQSNARAKRVTELEKENKELRALLQEAATLAEKRRLALEQLTATQQNVGVTAFTPTPPAEPSDSTSLGLEAITASPDFPDDVRDDLEVIKEPSDEEINLTSKPEEAPEGHASAPPSTEIETATTSATEAIPTMVSQPDVPTEDEKHVVHLPLFSLAVTAPTSQKGITATELAERFRGMAVSSVTRAALGKTEEQFATWSADKDPENMAWRYLKESKTFVSYE